MRPRLWVGALGCASAALVLALGACEDDALLPDFAFVPPEAGRIDATLSDPADGALDGSTAVPRDAGCIDASAPGSLGTDPDNCGACGIVCPSGLCTHATCVIGLSDAGTYGNHIASDGTNVYWTDFTKGLVLKTPIAGGPTTTLATGQPGASGISVDGNNVYWVNYEADTVMRLALNAPPGTAPTPIATDVSNGADLALDGTNVYWVSFTTGTLSVAAKSTVDAGTTIAFGLSGPYRVATDDRGVYWTEYSGGTVNFAAPDGGSRVVLATGQSHPNGIAVDDTYVYWVNGAGTASVNKALKTTGAGAIPVATDQANPYSIAVDPSGIYWLNYFEGNHGQVMRASHGGGVPTEIAQRSGTPFRDLVTTDQLVIWTAIGAPYSLQAIPK